VRDQTGGGLGRGGGVQGAPLRRPCPRPAGSWPRRWRGRRWPPTGSATSSPMMRTPPPLSAQGTRGGEGSGMGEGRGLGARTPHTHGGDGGGLPYPSPLIWGAGGGGSSAPPNPPPPPCPGSCGSSSTSRTSIRTTSPPGRGPPVPGAGHEGAREPNQRNPGRGPSEGLTVQWPGSPLRCTPPPAHSPPRLLPSCAITQHSKHRGGCFSCHAPQFSSILGVLPAVTCHKRGVCLR